ncbi:unnamed protein product, partial [Ilex paraguariensis]
DYKNQKNYNNWRQNKIYDHSALILQNTLKAVALLTRVPQTTAQNTTQHKACSHHQAAARNQNSNIAVIPMHPPLSHFEIVALQHLPFTKFSIAIGI